MRGGDRIQPRLRRRQPGAVDGRGVQVGAIVVTDLLRAAAIRRLRGQRLDDPAHLLPGALVELVKGTPAGTVGWNLMGVDPQAVGIAVEIVSGPHAGVAGGEIQAPRADLRVRGRGRRRRPRWRVGAAGERKRRGQRHHVGDSWHQWRHAANANNSQPLIQASPPSGVSKPSARGAPKLRA
jgi:hypothetical protein